MSSNLKVNTILPSTGTTIGIGTVGGLINVVGNIDVNSTSGISTFNGLEISGIVTAKAGAAVTYYGDGSNLTGITQTTINNNADNRVITGSGTANTLNGESNLTFDGNNLAMSGTGVFTLTRNSRTLTLEGNYGNEGHPAIKPSSGHDLRIMTSGNNERLRIGANGYAKIGSGTPKAQLDVKQQGNSWEDAVLIQHDNANTGWNIHAERTNSALWIGYNSNTCLLYTSPSPRD